MNTSPPEEFPAPCPACRSASPSTQSGFTLIEVVLVMVLVVIISGISIPYFAGTARGTKLRTAARTIERVSRYGRSMAIMREETLTMVLNPETMEVMLGGQTQSTTNSADGELDQEVLKRLGYIEDASSDSATAGIDPEIHRLLPDGLYVREFTKDWTDEDLNYRELYLVNFYPNGQSDWFELELEDSKGTGIKLENDPISGKIRSEFLQ